MKILRTALCLLIAFGVLAHGVVEVWSLALLEIGATLLLVLWASLLYRDPHMKIVWNPLNWPLLGFIAIGIFQLLFRLSAYPYLTLIDLLKYVAYFVVFFLFTQAFRERANLLRFAWFLILLGFAVSLSGIVQHFTSQGEIYWFRKPVEGGDIFGPYVNRNHFAGFVELVLPVGLALMVFRGLRRDLYPMAVLLTLIPLGALVLCGSRGGMVGFAFELGLLALLARTRRRRGKESQRLLTWGIIGLAAMAFLVWLGAGKLAERFSNVRKGDVSLERRVTLFEGASRIFLHHPVLGTGMGTLVSVFPRYETAYDGRLVEHAHNDYIETLANMGILGGICGLAFLWFLFRGARQSWEAEQGHFSRALHAAAVMAVGGLLLHGLVDFNLQIPANAILFLVQAGLATSLPLPSENVAARTREYPRSRKRVPI